jgi:glycosyltransferase involved in cell wall biosynthesis
MSSINGMQSDIKNPVFTDAQSTAVVANLEQTSEDDPYYEGPKVNVIVLSYNRPRMLMEALHSVFMQGYYNMTLWVIDDGSDFDVDELIDNFIGQSVFKVILNKNEKISVEDRTQKSRIASSINNVLQELPRGEYVTYLCDDDIMPPQWLRRAAIALSANSDYHVINGELYWFKDGDNWMKDHHYGISGFNNQQTAWYSTGSVIHLSDCFIDEGLRWYDNEYGHSQDIHFLNDLFSIHPDHLSAAVPANVRREHNGTLSKKLGRINEEGRYVLDFVPGKITSEMVSGMMET